MKTVLITGGAGFIGSHTADAMAARGWQVRIVDNLQAEVHGGEWPSYILHKGYELIEGDVRDKNIWLRCLPDVSAVLHLAAYQDQRLDFSRFFSTNSVSTALLYECIVEKQFPVEKVVLASSQFVYGDGQYICRQNQHTFYAPLRTKEQLEAGEWNILCSCGSGATSVPFRENQEIFPTNSYGLSKKSLEEIGIVLGKTYGVPTTCVRYSIVQGERQSPKNMYSGALRIFVSQAIAGLPITVYEDGQSTRDFVNVHDVAAANVLFLTSPVGLYECFNVGGGYAYTVESFARSVLQVTGSASPITIGGYRRTDTRHAVSDCAKLLALGWRPTRAPEKSVADYVRWYLAEGYDKKADLEALKQLKKGLG